MRYDLHVHTSKSGCSNLLAETVLRTAKKRKLDGIAVVDHNTIEGALKVKKLNNDSNFEVIVGAEIKTDSGEVIGLYLKEEIKSRKLDEVIDEIRKQNGIVIIPHPFSRGIFRKGLSANLESIKDKADAIEVINRRCLFSSENRKALKFADKFNLAKTAGSDAHFASEIGKCYTEFEGELRKSLNDKTAKPFGRIGFSLFWRGLSFLEKYFVKRLRCQKCSFDLDWLE